MRSHLNISLGFSGFTNSTHSRVKLAGNSDIGAKRRGNLASMANPKDLKNEPVVQIYSRENCHLCQEAESVVREALKDLSFKLEVIYIDGNQELERLYGEEVPVTLIDGAKHDYFRVDRKRFSEAILRQHQ